MKSTPMITADTLSCFRHDQALFCELSFSCAPGDILHIIGPNGCGKSTLLQILAGLMPPQQGRVCWSGADIQAVASHYRSQLFYLGHKTGVKASLTVWGNLQHTAQLLPVKAGLSWDDILAWFQLQPLRDRLCQHLSAGQRQRVALSRLLMTSAPLWILDEPFTALDMDTVVLLKQLILRHTEQGGMVVLTSHHQLHFPGAALKALRLGDNDKIGSVY
jgi:heme exporter protein A